MTKFVEGSWAQKRMASDLQDELDKCDYDRVEANEFLLDQTYLKGIVE